MSDVHSGVHAHLLRITTRFHFSSLGFGAVSPYAMTGQQFIGLYPDAFPCQPSQAEAVHGRAYQLSGTNGWHGSTAHSARTNTIRFAYELYAIARYKTTRNRYGARCPYLHDKTVRQKAYWAWTIIVKWCVGIPHACARLFTNPSDHLSMLLSVQYMSYHRSMCITHKLKHA